MLAKINKELTKSKLQLKFKINMLLTKSSQTLTKRLKQLNASYKYQNTNYNKTNGVKMIAKS